MNRPAPSERSFGLSVGLVLAVIGGILWWRGYQTAGPVLAAIGGTLVFFGLVAPPVLRVPNRLWWRFAQVLGRFNTRVLLTVFFAVVLTPVGVVMRLAGRSPLRPAGRDSNWVRYPASRRDPGHFERLF
jgi:hypothetical protein